jgi:type IV pilus assembly protein PilW
MAGVSLIELMVGITLGLLILAGLASVFANTSRSRTELERTSRQIENGRYAMEILGDDLRMAGFYGEFSVNTLAVPAALPDPCSTDPTVWAQAIRVAVQGYDTGTSAPACMPANVKANTDIIVVRRTAGCQAGVSGCSAATSQQAFFQAAKCGTQVAATNTSYILNRFGQTFDRQLKDCATNAGMRRYFVNIYYISTQNDQGTSIPTLKRLELNDTSDGFNEVTLVEGIEQMNIEYGVDYTGSTACSADGQPDAWTADPTNFTPTGCTGSDVINWSNVVAARINILARNTEASPTYTDNKTYTLGLDAAGNPVTVTNPNDNYHRHAYNTVVRLVNVSQRRELP